MKLIGRTCLLAAGAVLAVQAGCDSPTSPKDRVPAHLDIVAGDLQTQTVAKELPQPLVVKVTDESGHAVKGQIINFRVIAGNGTVFAGAALTDVNGEARERWTLGTVSADTQRVEARAVDAATGQALVFATFRAVGTADAPSSIGPADAAAFTGFPLLPLADSVAAVVRDVYGNPVPGTAVVWTVTLGGGSAAPATSNTSPAGVARTSWTLGPQLDSLQVLEAAAGLTLKTQFTANGHVPSDAVIVKISGDAQTGTAGQVLPQPLVVRVQRANGTALKGIPVTFTLPFGSGSVSPATVVSDASGQVSVQWTLGTGIGSVSATAGIASGAQGSFAATAVSGAPATLQKVGGDQQQAGTGTTLADSLVVRVVDAFANPVSGVTVSWSAASGTVAPAAAVSRADGTARAAYKLPATSGTVPVQAAAPGVAPVTFSETAVSTAVRMTILAPPANAVAGDSVTVTVRIDGSSAAVQKVVAAAVGGDSVLLAPEGTPGTVGNRLPLLGLPRGAVTLRITGTTVNGDTSIVTRDIIRDLPPVLSATSPADGTIATPSVRIDADCTDDDPAGCRSVVATLDGLGADVATGTTGIHTSVSLAGWEGRSVLLRIIATDSRNQSVSAYSTLYVESSAALSEVGSGGTAMLDADSTRLAFTDAAGALFVRSGGSDAPVAAGLNPRFAHLHPYGVIFNRATVYDWRPPSSLTVLGTANTDQSVRTRGNWAIWSSGIELFLRDLAAQASTRISGSALNANNDVAANGDVVWAERGPGPGYDIHRYRAGTDTPLTADDDSQHWNVYPVTDGANVLYTKSNQNGNSSVRGIGTVALWKAGVETVLSGPLSDSEIGYAANGGWIAWTALDGGGILRVQTRAPDGTERVATSGSAAALRALSPSGSVVYVSGLTLWAARAPYTAPPVRVAHQWSDAIVFFRGDQLWLLLGRTAFVVQY
jgi:hypothetical protein